MALLPFEIKAKELQFSKVSSVLSLSPRDAFLKELESRGFTHKGIPEIGRIVRCKCPTDKPLKESGWYIYYEMTDQECRLIGLGSFGSWKGDPEKVTWCSRSTNTFTPDEKNAFKQRMADAKRQHEEQKALNQAVAAQKALVLWNESESIETHPYANKKNIIPYTAKRYKDQIVVPVIVNDELTSLQFISPSGDKKFLPQGRIKGGYCILDGRESNTDDASKEALGVDSCEKVYICEGYATGCTIAQATKSLVYIAFNAGNLFEVTSFVKSKYENALITICADDDAWTDGNTGLSKATEASNAFCVRMKSPEFEEKDMGGKPTDFNDMATLYGVESVKDLLESIPIILDEPEGGSKKEELPLMTGVIRDIYAYYMATDGNDQKGFAIQTALALCSVVCGRYFKTEDDNFASLYFLNIGKSATGKEHPKTVIERILLASDMDDLISGDGFTSAGGVMSSLMNRPKQISVIDEFGRYIMAGNSAGNANQIQSNSMIMEAFARCHGILRSQNYSMMGMNKDQAAEVLNRKVCNPSLTIMAMTTPSTFFEAIDIRSVQDGFLNRFIIHISDAERKVRERNGMIDVPNTISDWCNAITERCKDFYTDHSEPSRQVILSISQEARKTLREFSQWCIDMANELEKDSLSEMTGRSAEQAMRIGLIAALSENPMAEKVEERHMSFGVEYVRMHLNKTIKRMQQGGISVSAFDKDKLDALDTLFKAGAKGLSKSEMFKTYPFKKWKPKERDEILAALIEADAVRKDVVADGGRPRETFFHTGVRKK